MSILPHGDSSGCHIIPIVVPSVYWLMVHYIVYFSDCTPSDNAGCSQCTGYAYMCTTCNANYQLQHDGTCEPGVLTMTI